LRNLHQQTRFLWMEWTMSWHV